MRHETEHFIQGTERGQLGEMLYACTLGTFVLCSTAIVAHEASAVDYIAASHFFGQVHSSIDKHIESVSRFSMGLLGGSLWLREMYRRYERFSPNELRAYHAEKKWKEQLPDNIIQIDFA